MRIEQEAAKLVPPDLAPLQKQQEQLEAITKRVTGATEALGEASAKAAIEVEKASKKEVAAVQEFNKARGESVAVENRFTDATLKSAESFRTLADGAFTATRGLVLMGLEGDENLQKIVQGLAEAQAKFDLVRGGVDVFRGGIETAGNFGEALQALDTDFGKVGQRATALVGLLGPGGPVILGATAAAAVIAALYFTLGQETESAAEKAERELDELVRKLDATRRQIEGERDIQDRKLQNKTLQKAIDEREDRIKKIGRGLAPADVQAQLDVFAQRDALSEAVEAARQLRQGAELRAPRRFGSDGITEFSVATPEVLRARDAEQRAIAALEAGGGQVQDAERSRLEAQVSESIKRLNEVNEDQQANITARGSIFSNSKAVQERQEAVLEAALEQERLQERAARDRLRRAEEADAERIRKIALERARLSPAQRNRVDQLGQQLRDGSISRAGIDSLESLAPNRFGQDINDFLIRGEGVEPAARRDAVADARAALARESSDVSSAQSQLDQFTAESRESAEATKAALQSLKNLANEVIDNVGRLEAQQRELKDQLETAN